MPLSGISPPDPYKLNDTSEISYYGYRQTLGRTTRPFTINPALKTLVLFVTGQSLGANVVPTLFVPTNSAAVDNLNIYDGALYDCNGPLLGSPYNPTVVPPL